MTLWDHLCCFGYGVQARIEAIQHVVKGHKIHWRSHIDLWCGLTGDIWCEGCPEATDSPNDVVFWIRSWGWMLWVGNKICGLLGHRWDGYWQKYNYYDFDGELLPIDTDKKACKRCVN